MSMRAVDAMPLLSVKKELKNTLADTDCNAVYQNGAVLPVFIKNGGSQLYVELEYQFADPKTVQGFVRFVQKPIPVEPEPVHAQTRQLKGGNYHETRKDAAVQGRTHQNSEYARREQALGITQADIDAGTAMYEREAQEKVRARNADRRKNK